VWFHKAGTSGYVQRRALTASTTGTWSTSYVAGDDYRVYASSGPGSTAPVLIQVAPTITGPATRIVRRGSTVPLAGTGLPGQVLTLHFHAAGTPAGDYSILRSVLVRPDGTWQRPYIAGTDYRIFASLPNGRTSPTVLIQAR
jgi:hypothetical protein